MSNFGRHLWNLGAGLFWIGILFFAVATPISMIMATGCSQEEYEVLESPDGKFRAVVIASGCGSFSRPNTQFFIEKLPIDPYSSSERTEMLLMLTGTPQQMNYKLKWSENYKLIISEFEFSDIISYQKQYLKDEYPEIVFEIAQS